MEFYKPYIDMFEDPNISEREKYKYYTQNDKRALELKEQIRKVVVDRGLNPVMNDTKWLKLQCSIEQLPFPPAYIEKLIHEDKSFDEIQIADAPQWLGNWSPFYQEGMSLFFMIEYLIVRPRYTDHSGGLVAPKIYDISSEFEARLKEMHIPYEEEQGTFTIYGYK
jgi:hypothetical protein